VAVRRGGYRLIGNPLGQELSGQAAAVDLLKPVQSQARAGHDPAGQTRLQAGLLILGLGLGSGLGSGDGMSMARMAGRRSSCSWTFLA
jgi:hypothetical protein